MPLLLPSAIAYDASGNLYIAESQRHAIRRVDTTGNIATYAGDGIQGFGGDGGPAASAHLNSPQGVAVDAAGDVYISDSSNNRVRRVDAITGTIATIAGTGVAGFSGDGGPANSATLDLPRAICVDIAARNLYIADSRNHRIRHIDLTTGIIDTVAGSGIQGFSGDGAIATSASLDSPDSIALDTGGNLYIADTHNRRVRRVALDTRILSTILGTGLTGGASTAASSAGTQLALPRGINSDAQGNLYIVDSGNHRVLKVDHTTGTVTSAAGGATQGFSGDNGPAVSAALDSPRAVALTPAGLVSIADTGNQKVRQLLAEPAPATQIQTIAGLGAAVSGIFSLTAPSVVAYGTGSLTASLSASVPASGQVTFLDITDNSSAVIGTSPLTENSASISLSTAPAGQHRFMATYAGDTTHASAQTPISVLTITPLPLTATAATAAIVYGTVVPVLSGSLNGLLPQDAARVAASFTTSATSLSPAGSYPIAVTLSGPGAANYNLQPSSANLLITRANSFAILRNDNTDGSFSGTLEVQVSSSTSGTPSGTVTLLDNGAVLQNVALTSAGSFAFQQIALSAGTHGLTATYSGDQNFLPSSSSPATVSISPAPSADFTIAAAQPTSQILASGSSVSYMLSVQLVGGGLPSQIALSVSGLPAFTKASFSPAYVPPGGGATSPVVLTVTAPTSSALRMPSRTGMPSSLAVLALSFPAFTLLFGRKRSVLRSKLPTLIAATAAIFIASTLAGCGDRVNAGAQSSSSLQSYTLTVTGTGTNSKGSPVQHSASIMLQMNTAQ